MVFTFGIHFCLFVWSFTFFSSWLVTYDLETPPQGKREATKTCSGNNGFQGPFETNKNNEGNGDDKFCGVSFAKATYTHQQRWTGRWDVGRETQHLPSKPTKALPQ